MRWIPVFLCVLFTAPFARAANFEVGQVWRYETRPNETGSLLTVVKIEDVDGAKVVHISLAGLKIEGPMAEGGFVETVGHLPISEEALAGSVTELVRVSQGLPDYEEGYKQWREAFDRGQAGYFTLPVSECVAAIEQAMKQ